LSGFFLAQSLLHTTGYITPDTIKHKCQERIRHLLHTATADKLSKIKSRANTAYGAIPNTSHRLLIIKSGFLPHSRTTSTLHKITRPDKTTSTLPHRSPSGSPLHLDTELTRATPPELPLPPWEQPDNPNQFFIEPRGDSTLTLADIITRYAFDKTINSLGTGKAPGQTVSPTES
jgi:hypothetical protein